MSRPSWPALLALSGLLAACQAAAPSVTPTAALSVPAATPGATPQVTPAATPEATFSCPPPSLTFEAPSNRLTGVGVSSGPGFDEVVFSFGPGGAGSGTSPSLTVAPADPPFVEGASGLPLAVAGQRFIVLIFRDMVVADEQGNPTDPGPARQTPVAPAVREVVRSEAFEGVVSWLIGTAAPGCARVAVDQAAGRVLVDVAHP